MIVSVAGQAPAPGTATYSLDGGPDQPYTGTVSVSTNGFHTLIAQTADGSASKSFLVDSSAPTITFTSPSAEGAVLQGSSATASFSCADAGIGIQSCQSTGEAFTTSALGLHTFRVRAVDKLNKPTETTISYLVIGITTPPVGAAYARGTAVSALYACGFGAG